MFSFSAFLAVEKKGGNLEKFIWVEQASEHKKINFAQCKVKNFKKHSQIYENTNE